MLKRYMPLVALTLSLAAEAHGGIPNVEVWFEATPVSPFSTVVQQGVQGGDLILGCDTSGGAVTCEWDLSMKVFWDTTPIVSVIGSAGTDILGDTDKHTLSNFQVGDYPLDSHNFDPVDAGGLLADTRAVQIPIVGDPPMFEVIPQGEYTLLTTRLTTDMAPGDDFEHGIDMAVNSLLWVLVNDPDGPPITETLVQFGDAGAIDGTQQGATAEDVIVVQNIPEPATAGLLALGLAVMISRRRRTALPF